MNSDIVKPEKIGHPHLEYHFTVPLNDELDCCVLTNNALQYF